VSAEYHKKKRRLRLPLFGGKKSATQPAAEAQSGSAQQPGGEQGQPTGGARPAARGRGLFGGLFGSKPKRAAAPEYRTRVISIEVIPGRVLEEYEVGAARVVIADDGRRFLYLVQEPPLSARDQEVYGLIMEALYYALRPTDSKDVAAALDSFAWAAAEDLGVAEDLKASWPRIRYYLHRDALGYGVIDVPMRDPLLEEVSCTGPGRPVGVIHRSHPEAGWMDTNIQFNDDEELSRFVQRLVQRAGRSVTIARPMADSMTPEGHRVAVTLRNEISLPGSTFTIRKFTEEPITITNLLAWNTLSPLMAAYLWILLEYRGFVFVVGATGAGKTTTMNALLGMLDPRAKIATIEETPELRIPQEHWERLMARLSYGGGAFDVDLFQLTKLSLRLRPDYVVVGEARGEEIQALFQAAATGHGALSSFHSDSARGALVRMAAPPLNVGIAAQMLIWAFAVMNRVRLPGGSVARRMIEVEEVQPTEAGISLRRMFSWDSTRDAFTPEDPHDVVAISARLETVGRLAGWDALQLERELASRASFLSALVKRKVFRFADLSEEFTRWYRWRYLNGPPPEGVEVEAKG